MEVILLERIERLGKLGDVVRVKDGYARNYLLPQRKALRATKEAHAHFETERAKIEQANDTRRGDASAVAKQMAGLEVVMVEQAGESGQLYGSVSARDIAASLSAAGHPVDRHQVVVNAVIKSLGLHKVQVRLHAEALTTT
jgi:large subunit ribosomal protein L9